MNILKQIIRRANKSAKYPIFSVYITLLYIHLVYYVTLVLLACLSVQCVTVIQGSTGNCGVGFCNSREAH